MYVYYTQAEVYPYAIRTVACWASSDWKIGKWSGFSYYCIIV